MSDPRASSALGRAGTALLGVGATLAAFVAAAALESVYVSIAHGALLAGGWETAAIRNYVLPVSLAFLVPTAIAMRLLGALVARSPEDPIARRLTASMAMAFAALVGWGVSEGRHFAAAPVRMAFVLALAVGAAVATLALVTRLARAPHALLALLGVAVALGAWLADAFVLPRLYPAFHAALFLIALGGVALTSIAIPIDRAQAQQWGRALAGLTLVIAGCGLAFARTAAERLRTFDNLRLVLAERAPLLGRAVRVAASLAPQREATLSGVDSDGTDPNAPSTTATGATARLDFRGRDVLFVTIDALRADHVGAYGYTRPTTPNLDRLAREGVRFEAAYCPTPHTSYSVTSMMTGKYMRPLLALGVGEDSDTWAGIFRQYGYRTAAFYPPAVFFIDESRFRSFRDRGLDFEYRKVEFAPSELRVQQVDEYLSRASSDQPVFIWVHLFEPHEPYVMHAAHPFGDARAPRPVDAYDSEIAAADEALGALVERLKRRRQPLVTIVAADHGEEFGEHGGRYHGTSVYEEQVRVPLVVATEGLSPAVVSAPVQTIDLFPTMLAAAHVPRPARVRGRDLAPLLTGAVPKDRGFAFAETEDHTMVAEGEYRLVCERRLAACALFDAVRDPFETKDLGRERPDVAARLRARGTDLARSHGRFERGSSADYPDALRRAMQGDADAALEIAPLLDDVRLDLRRAAARAIYDLRVIDTAPFAERAMSRGDGDGDGDGDEEVKRWTALALVRMTAPASVAAPGVAAAAFAPPPAARAIAEALLGEHESHSDWRFRAALALAEAGDGRGSDVLVGKLGASAEAGAGKGDLSFSDERALVRVLGKLREKRAVGALAKALDDVRLRPLAAEALAAIGDPSARPALVRAFERERYVSMRGVEARALVTLGARAEIEPALRRFAGVPEPWPEALRLAQSAGLLRGEAGAVLAPAEVSVRVRANLDRAPRRLYVRPAPARSGPATGDAGTPAASPEVIVTTGKGQLAPVLAEGDISVFELPEDGEGVEIACSRGIEAFWVVPRVAELAPPPPVPWDAGTSGSTPDVDRAPLRQ